MTKATREFLLFSFIRALTLFMKILLSWPNISPEVPPPNTISSSTRFQHINCGGIQAFSLNTSLKDFPGGPDGKAPAYNAGDPSSIPGSKKISWRRKRQPTPVSCLENPMEGGVWQGTVHGVAKSQIRLSDFNFLSFYKHSGHSDSK